MSDNQETTAPENQSNTTPPPERDWKAEFEALQVNARKWEARAKAQADAAKELEALKAQSMTDQERAVAEAQAAARAAVLSEVGGKLVDAEMRAALAGRNIDVDAVLEVVDGSKFLVDGEPDRKKIAEWVDRFAPVAGPAERKPADLGQGARLVTSPGQIRDRDELKRMTPQEINAARKAGRLDDLLKGR